jgi:hypothetical protein
MAFGLLLVVAASLILHYNRGLSLQADDWDFVVRHRGAWVPALLTPHGPHLSLVTVVIYKVLLHVFGARSYLPFRVLAAADLVMLALVLGWAGREWWGRWGALVPVVLYVSLGQDSLLWSVQVGYSVALAGGLIALVTINRGGRKYDLIACVALVASLASSSQGVGFLAGAAVMVLLAGNWRRRAWVVLVPAVLYAIWWIEYGRQASETHFSLWPHVLIYLVGSLSASLPPLVGLSHDTRLLTIDTTYGVPMALAALGAFAYSLWRGWRPPSLFWGALVTIVVIWILASLSNWGPFDRAPSSPRYLAVNAYLVLTCLFTAVPFPRLARRGVVVVASVVLVMAATTVQSQYPQGRHWLSVGATYSRAQVGALDLMQGVVAPQFVPETGAYPSLFIGFDAGQFFSANAAYGGIEADSPAQLASQSEAVEDVVDSEMARGELSLVPGAPALLDKPPLLVAGNVSRSGGCLVLTGGPIEIDAPAGRFELRAGPTPLLVAVERFAANYSVALGPVPAHAAYVVTVPADRDPQRPWRIALNGQGGRVCSAASTPSG